MLPSPSSTIFAPVAIAVGVGPLAQEVFTQALGGHRDAVIGLVQQPAVRAAIASSQQDFLQTPFQDGGVCALEGLPTGELAAVDPVAHTLHAGEALAVVAPDPVLVHHLSEQQLDLPLSDDVVGLALALLRHASPKSRYGMIARDRDDAK